MEFQIYELLNTIKETHGYDFTGCRKSMLQRRIGYRMMKTHSESFEEYREKLQQDTLEQLALIQALTIQVSEFFRDPLVFEYLAHALLKSEIKKKISEHDPTFRVWSAGCAYGEEAYSLAMLLDYIAKNEKLTFDLSIFATDVNPEAITQAKKGVYPETAIKNVRYAFVKEYFQKISHDGSVESAQTPLRNSFQNGIGAFSVAETIKKQVYFSQHDLMDMRSIAPTESVINGFDLVMCRNVLIYFDPEHQLRIFDKLLRAVNRGGLLVIGPAELPPTACMGDLKQLDACCKVYRVG